MSMITTTGWRDPTADPDARLDALIAEMTVAEKVAQLGSVWLGFDVVTGEVAPMQNAFSRDLAWPAAAAEGLGHFTRILAGRIDEALVDRALRRVLAQKLELGLLDDGWSPEPLNEDIDFDSAGNRDIARRMAESSIVLLDNPAGVLPLDPIRRIAVIGPCADDPRVFFGCYALPNHVIPRYPDFDKDIGIVAESLLSAPAASAEVSFTVHSDWLSFTGRTMERIVEPGEVLFRVGNSDATFAGPLAIQLTGETRTIRGERVMDTPVAVSNPH